MEAVMKTARENKIDFFAYTSNEHVMYVSRKFSVMNLIAIFRNRSKTIAVHKDCKNLTYSVKKFVMYGKQENMDNFRRAIAPYNFSIFN
jgi:fructose/tagatose bisphosphate aldolase